MKTSLFVHTYEVLQTVVSCFLGVGVHLSLCGHGSAQQVHDRGWLTGKRVQLVDHRPSDDDQPQVSHLQQQQQHSYVTYTAMLQSSNQACYQILPSGYKLKLRCCNAVCTAQGVAFPVQQCMLYTVRRIYRTVRGIYRTWYFVFPVEL